ncbi:hypothetical protein HO173_010331 [Letharia columbiana]|uniref:YMC020W-like alpha/beta hydrolase domain-containing protein n=1 Tax=Letharia columbiana TaxID=112416 RepID=A0A8H6FN50_9LECA|nr:uncharacterized protein HO173_010331 [Letharia columbiana]KAF6231579.1 hypothetical protein HO173_010331 [Letharia columbiana]
MGPRKRSKPNPKAEPEPASAEAPLPQGPELQSRISPKAAVEQSKPSIKPEGVEPIHSSVNGANSPQSSKTWYGGTWPRGKKSSPVTQVAKESISAAGGAASEALASARAHTPELSTTPLKSPALYLSKSIGSSSRSLPLAATTTKLHITSNAIGPANGAAKDRSSSKNERDQFTEYESRNGSSTAPEGEKSDDGTPENTAKNCDTRPESKSHVSEVPKAANESTSWLNWFSKSETVTENGTSTARRDDDASSAGKNTPQSFISDVLQDGSASPKPRRNSEPSPVSPSAQQEEAPRSWLSLWSNASTQTKSSSSASAIGVASNPQRDSFGTEPQTGKVSDAGSCPMSTPQTPQQPTDGAKPSYGWAFWSRDQPKSDVEKTRPGSEIGELALAGSSLQSKPENAVVDEAGGVPNKVSKRQRPQSLEVAADTKKPRGSGDNAKSDSNPDAIPLDSKTKPKVDAGSKSKGMPENLLLPSFKTTYSTVGRPSLIQQISRLLQLRSTLEPKHVDIVQNPPRVRRALAIGVHGYFPAPLIRSVLGQPTGTSIRFANSAASAIQRWTQNQGFSCEIEKVALEGEGKIAERIDLLWKLMLNWIEKIRRADFVMIACHSQGVPVAMMLVAKLIAFGCVNSAKIGVCAMAGVNLGPFADYKSRWISGSAGELFDFALPNSQVSKDYEAALDVALRFGVKVVYVGSIDDQLVSLESSTFGCVSHPHIFRAVFVDGRLHAPDFLTHLVGFALKLRNLGISDHGVIRELSSPLAGSLYGGEGHSRIYDDEAGYYLAVEHALETTSLGEISPQFHRDGATTSQNPYILPFAMRGVLEEDYVRTELYGEITELIKQFDEWKPSTKALKDVKFRLEGVRSKL